VSHEFYIKRCLQIAKNGIGTTRPNPSVGAVIVVNNNIIGEGFTAPYGGSHAEVNAINAVANKDLLKQATLYVTLEPCAHFGKTPPCADLIVKHQLKNVVIGCVDSNPLVAGKGVEHLQKSGINVVVGVLETACKTHHKRFFTVQNKKRPYVILKWAETKDGFVAPHSRTAQKPVWISNAYSQQKVHKLRSKEHAVLVGTRTVLDDNPKLNVRSWSGTNPIRVVLDRTARISPTVTVLDGSVQTIVFSEKQKYPFICSPKIHIELIDFSKNIAIQICEVLQKYKIQSLIIEGGSQTLQTFIDAEIWDEAHVYIGAVCFHEGVKAPRLVSGKMTETQLDNDLLKIYTNA
jgi:diaminohydroxyphosphoribosylaminopyrimidine deaminase/5-amino-6-(5-phosphoribosylamino)uracil reductase